MGVNFKTQQLIENIYLVDFIFGKNVVVEMQGPHHYCSDDRMKPTNKTALKKQVLENLGFYVFHIHLVSSYNVSMPRKFCEDVLQIIKNKVDDVYKGLFNEN